MNSAAENTFVYDEASLLLLISEDDELAFRVIFDHYRHKIYSLAFHLTRSRFLSVEIVQEVFIKMWTARKSLPFVQCFRSWLKTVTRNTIKNHLRSLARERHALQEMQSIRQATATSPEHAVTDRHYQQALLHAIENLPPQQKKVYQLSRQAGLKNDEIALQMGLSVYTVKEYLSKALQTLRTKLMADWDVMALLIALLLCR